MTKPFVLIVEDDPKLNEIIFIALQADFELETCTDGNAALERLRNRIPNIVVLDLNLPGSSGREILAYIRSDERLSKTSIILATADERQAETLTNDADIILLKPVSPGLLRDLTLRMSGIKQDTTPRRP
jgi:two-component system alkaline phosphatase synthesis response regulator PhoP